MSSEEDLPDDSEGEEIEEEDKSDSGVEDDEDDGDEEEQEGSDEEWAPEGKQPATKRQKPAAAPKSAATSKASANLSASKAKGGAASKGGAGATDKLKAEGSVSKPPAEKYIKPPAAASAPAPRLASGITGVLDDREPVEVMRSELVLDTQQPSYDHTLLKPSKALRAAAEAGSLSVIKRSKASSSRATKYLVVLPGFLSPVAAGEIGALEKLDTQHPELLLSWPGGGKTAQGTLRLRGSLIHSKARYVGLVPAPKEGGFACDDELQMLLVFSEAEWIGADGKPSALPAALYAEIHGKHVGLLPGAAAAPHSAAKREVMETGKERHSDGSDDEDVAARPKRQRSTGGSYQEREEWDLTEADDASVKEENDDLNGAVWAKVSAKPASSKAPPKPASAAKPKATPSSKRRPAVESDDSDASFNEGSSPEGSPPEIARTRPSSGGTNRSKRASAQKSYAEEEEENDSDS